MNKVILMGRLTKDPEVRYSQSAEPIAIARYSLAVNRKFKREGEPEADFVNCTAFGKIGEFAEKYFKKGQMVSVIGRIQNRSWDDATTGQKKYATDVIIEEQYFAESKRSYDANNSGNTSYSEPSAPKNAPQDFSTISEPTDDDLPF